MTDALREQLDQAMRERDEAQGIANKQSEALHEAYGAITAALAAIADRTDGGHDWFGTEHCARCDGGVITQRMAHEPGCLLRKALKKIEESGP